MNIQTTELPKEVSAQALDRVAKAVAQKDEQHPAVHEPSLGGGRENSQEAGPLDRKEAEQLVNQAREYFTQKGVDLNFKFLDDGKELQVEVLDAKSHKVIRKIPEDEIVTLADNLKRMAKGVLDKSV